MLLHNPSNNATNILIRKIAYCLFVEDVGCVEHLLGFTANLVGLEVYACESEVHFERRGYWNFTFTTNIIGAEA